MAHFDNNEGEFTPDSLVLGPWMARKVKLKGGQGALKRGHVLGKITTDGAEKGKFAVSKSASTDGSQEPDAILSKDTDTAGGDVDAVIFTRGTFDQRGLILGAGHSVDSIYQPFRLRSIFLENTIG